ncbi:MAG: 30S ribosomal protein S8 [Chloroflexi bacterium]|nr:30S ribosomal protein S8 [Chloroflexota bacterium]
MAGVVTDPIADLLTRIRNAKDARHEQVLIPTSNVKLAVARILKEEGFIKEWQVVRGEPHRWLKIQLAYTGRKQPVLKGLKRVSKPGLRIYVGKDKIPRILGGMGVAIISTSQGVMAGQEAKRRGIGGELLCYVW